MTIGDVLAVIAGVSGFGVSIWALLMATALLFDERTTQAKELLKDSPVRTMIDGGIWAASAGVLAVILLNQPNGLLKLVGWVLFLGLMLVITLGAGGLALLVSDRIRAVEPRLSPFFTMLCGAGLIVLSGMVPLLGWFILTPAAVVTSLGMGVRTLRQRYPVAFRISRRKPEDSEAPA